MFWITFFVSGLTVASIPWIASHFSNRISGYIVLIPVMMTLSLIVQYLSHGPEATTEMINSTLIALPTLLVFGLIAIFMIKQNFSLPLIVIFSIAGWLITVLIINNLVTK